MNMTKEEIILKDAFDALAENTGIQASYKLMPFKYGHRLDAEVQITINDTVLRFAAEVKRELRNYHLRELPQTVSDLPLMFIADRLFPAVKEELRSEKISYLDTAGNIFIQYRQTYIWVEGNRKMQGEKKQSANRAFTKQGLKVVFLFLCQNHMINMPYRKISDQAGVALGNIPLIMEGLREGQYLLHLNDHEFILNRKKALLHRWIEAYRDILKPSLHIGNFKSTTPDLFKERLMAGNVENAVPGGEVAAEMITHYLNAEIYTVYTTQTSKEFMVKNRLIPEEKGNIQVYEIFWDNYSKDGRVPVLLVYADLVITDEPRCLETAEILYEKQLKHEFE